MRRQKSSVASKGSATWLLALIGKADIPLMWQKGSVSSNFMLLMASYEFYYHFTLIIKFKDSNCAKRYRVINWIFWKVGYYLMHFFQYKIFFWLRLRWVLWSLLISSSIYSCLKRFSKTNIIEDLSLSYFDLGKQ